MKTKHHWGGYDIIVVYMDRKDWCGLGPDRVHLAYDRKSLDPVFEYQSKALTGMETNEFLKSLTPIEVRDLLNDIAEVEDHLTGR